MSAALVQKLVSSGAGVRSDDTITLTYDDRFLRRKRLETDAGAALLVDFEHTQSVEPGQFFESDDGQTIRIIAAAEPLSEVTGQALARYAWHIGNRHTPCQIEADRIVFQRNHVLSDMLRQLGADVRDIDGPFTPEGGAYGHGRTMGHSHD